MIWNIGFTKESQKFLEKNKIAQKDVFNLIQKTIQKFQGENINIDIKKLKGEWMGFYRIRKGKIRIIVEFDFDNFSVLIEQIDWRGGAYK